MKVKCPECEQEFDLDIDEYEEGDFVECPECGASLMVKVKYGRLTLVPETEKYEEYSLEEYYDEYEDEDYSSDEGEYYEELP